MTVKLQKELIYDLFSTPRYAQWKVKVHYSQYTGDWNVENKNYDKGNVKALSTYGTTRINGYKIVEETLNLRTVRIFDYVIEPDGKRPRPQQERDCHRAGQAGADQAGVSRLDMGRPAPP